MLTVIIPANNEAAWIGRCLGALFASEPVPGGAEAVVVANGCSDATAQVAREMAPAAGAAGWGLKVLDLAEGGKPLALNAGDAAAAGQMRAYLDADVLVSPPLMAALAGALAVDRPTYASGRPQVTADTALGRAYARFWTRLPFAQSRAPGFGLFAVNAAGRARWQAFPGIISDDTFVRLLFAPEERIEVQPVYEWPLVEGFSALARVRRRQDAGVAEIARLWPEVMVREAKQHLGLLGLAGLAWAEPLGFVAYAVIAVAVRLGRMTGRGKGWTRGR